jgi:hypothetical protein
MAEISRLGDEVGRGGWTARDGAGYAGRAGADDTCVSQRTGEGFPDRRHPHRTVTTPVGLLSVFADVAILVALAAAIASPKASQLARPVIATGAFGAAWLTAALSDLMRAPGWVVFLGGLVIVVSIFVVTVTVHAWAQEGAGGSRGPGDRGERGGGGPRRRPPDAPQPPGGGDAPEWWPEFERQLALYVAERERHEHEVHG